MRFGTVLSGFYWWLELQHIHTEYIVTSTDAYYGWNNIIITRKGTVFNLRFFRQCCWRFKSSGIWCFVVGD